MNTSTQRCVSDLMTRNVVTVRKTDFLHDAIRLMERNCVSALPVVDESDHVFGIVSNSDLVGYVCDLQSEISILPLVSEAVCRTLVGALAEDAGDLTVDSVMTTSVETITPEASMATAASKMVDLNVHHLPVVDSSGSPVGILSTTDIVRGVASEG